MKVKVTQSCWTLCNPRDYTVHGILQARILEWVAFPFPGDLPTQGLNPGPQKEKPQYWSGQPIPSPGDLPKPGTEPGSTALQADSLPTELLGKLMDVKVEL